MILCTVTVCYLQLLAVYTKIFPEILLGSFFNTLSQLFLDFRFFQLGWNTV